MCSFKLYLYLAGSLSVLSLIAQGAALAQTVPEAIPQEQTVPTATVENQITSVAQLADVQPTDWSFQALQ